MAFAIRDFAAIGYVIRLISDGTRLHWNFGMELSAMAR